MLAEDIALELLEKYEKHPSKVLQEFIAWLSNHSTDDIREIVTKWDRLALKEDKGLRKDVFDFLEKYKFAVLSKELIKKFGHELKPGEIGLRAIVDVRQKRVYLVPSNIEHVDFAAKLLKCSREELYQHPEQAAHLVGAYIKLRDGRVQAVAIGATTGLTLGAKVVYRAEDIDKAYAIIADFVFKGNVPYGDVKMQKMMPKG